MTMKCNSSTRGSRTDLAWAAGLLDGDGCLSISRQQIPGRKNKTFRLWLSLSQNCEATLQHFRGVIGEQSFVSVTGPNAKLKKPVFTLTYEGKHAIAVLRKVAPFLVRKGQKAKSAMKFWEEGMMGTLPGPKGFSEEVWVARESWFAAVRNCD